MMQVFRQQRARTVRPKGVAVLLAFWLNLVLLPCAMAIEVSEEAHDCCPPKIEWQSVDCCEIDALVGEKRGVKFEFKADFAPISATVSGPLVPVSYLHPPLEPPPDPANFTPPIHKLNCVYLD